MTLGTCSLLFGCHQFILHPIFVLCGWVYLYGWRTLNIPILLAIIIHDWGYFGCTTMDGPDGRYHPLFLPALFHPIRLPRTTLYEATNHSRHLNSTISRLCWADKLSLALIPSWLWTILAHLSGEGYEYMDNPYDSDYVQKDRDGMIGLYLFHKRIRVFFTRDRCRESSKMYSMPGTM